MVAVAERFSSREMRGTPVRAKVRRGMKFWFEGL
ncbi:hypothetical protein A2U01_0116038, partial [Trifolium medium]|nr:hypothetical protein [Trifolium medium]